MRGELQGGRRPPSRWSLQDNRGSMDRSSVWLRWLSAHDPQLIRGSPLLQRLVALAGEPRDICFLAGNAGTADACGLIVALQRFGALRFCCFVARSHCHPLGSGQGIIADEGVALKGVHVRCGSKGEILAASTCIPRDPRKRTQV